VNAARTVSGASGDLIDQQPCLIITGIVGALREVHIRFDSERVGPPAYRGVAAPLRAIRRAPGWRIAEVAPHRYCDASALSRSAMITVQRPRVAVGVLLSVPQRYCSRLFPGEARGRWGWLGH
jgi:hypothetical protein